MLATLSRLLVASGFPDRIDPGHALTNEHLNLAQLRNDLFRSVSLDSHS